MATTYLKAASRLRASDREWLVVGLMNAQKMEVGKVYRIGKRKAKVLEKTPPYSNHNDRVKVEWLP